MKIAVGSDQGTDLTEALLMELQVRGIQVELHGPMNKQDPARDWPLVAKDVAEAVSRGTADQGIACCWTGTGVSIAANKVQGVRAALVRDAETARGARIFNHANVMALSLRATTIPEMKKILQAWFDTPVEHGEAQSEWNRIQIERISKLEGEKE